jgi:4-amino-4-deoxy-L-arabinose transferase-like glycosyltransferase
MKHLKLPQNLIPLGITLLAFLLRAYRLDFQSYWIDEAWSVFFANLSLNEMWHRLNTTEPHPPFYHIATLLWVRQAGDSEYALRFFSLLFGVLAVPFTFRLGQTLGDIRLGLIAALLMAVAPFQIWHSQEARMYSVLTAASAMCMWGFVAWVQLGGRKNWLIYLTGTIFMISTHYLGLLLIGIQGFFLLLTWQKNRTLYLRFGATLALILMFILLWIIFSGNWISSYLNWVEQPTLADSYLRSAIAYSLNELVPREQAIPLMLIFATTYLLGLFYATRRRWGRWSGSEMLAFLIAFTLIPNFAAWLYGEIRTTVYLERYLIPVQVGYLLTIAAGILAVVDGLPRLVARLSHRPNRGATIWSRLAATVLLLTLIGINGWVLFHHYLDPVYAKPNWRAVAQTIANFEQPGDAILLTGDGGEQAFNYYYRGNLPVYTSFNIPLHQPVPRPEGDDALQILAGITGQHNRLWYTPYGMYLDPLLENWLAENTHPAWQSWLGRKRLALYDTRPAAGRTETFNTHFPDPSGQGPTLIKVELPNEPVSAGDLLPLTLTWQTDITLATNAQLSLRLINSRGDIFAQSDWPPLTATRPTSTWPVNQPITDRRSLWLSPDLPPGDYALQLVVYDPAAGSLGNPVIISGIAVAPAQIAPPLTALPIPNAMQQSLGSVSLVGYVAPASIRPGQETWLWLYWQAQTPPHPQTMVHLTLHSANETISFDLPLSDAAGPVESWQPGQVRRAVYHLATSPKLDGETATLRVALNLPAGQSAEITLSKIKLENRPREFEIPPLDHPLAITLGNAGQIKIIGADVPAGPSNDTLPVTLYWQARAEVDQDYTVFVQLLNSAGQVVSQVDMQPLEGAAPTTTWLPGEILTDPYTLQLPPNLPPGEYRLITGMYYAPTGQRLSVSTSGDFVELPGVTVK